MAQSGPSSVRDINRQRLCEVMTKPGTAAREMFERIFLKGESVNSNALGEKRKLSALKEAARKVPLDQAIDQLHNLDRV